MTNVFTVYKQPGQTPLEAVNEFKKLHPQYLNQKISYAGRLDPMAEGLLLLLVGPENKNRRFWEKLDKEYEFEAVFGITTDSLDILGVISQKHPHPVPPNLKQLMLKAIPEFTGTFSQAYPAYSSAIVSGKPLFYWARTGQINRVRIPSHQVQIYKINLINYCLKKINPEIIYRRIRQVNGCFRQKQILASWEKFFAINQNLVLPSCQFTASCSSGTYIRQLVCDLGGKIGTPALCLAIKRTAIYIRD